jgi:hypothetical protein
MRLSQIARGAVSAHIMFGRKQLAAPSAKT